MWHGHCFDPHVHDGNYMKYFISKFCPDCRWEVAKQLKEGKTPAEIEDMWINSVAER